MMMQSEDDQWVCPSFNSYSLNKLADIAARVSDEVNGDVKLNEESLHSIEENDEDNREDNEEDDDFEFSLVRDEFDESGVEIFCDGQVRPIFPIFNRDLLDDCDQVDHEGKNEETDRDLEISVKIPLKKLFIEEREAASSSSSEADELEAIPPGTYCVWRPKVTAPSSPSSCKKSKSTGSGSKRWKLRDLLRRSNSDGKESFVFLTAKKKDEKSDKRKSAGKSKAKATPSPSPSASPVHEAYYARKRATKGNETPRRKSYLPYRQDLVGFFTTVNSLGRALPKF